MRPESWLTCCNHYVDMCEYGPSCLRKKIAQIDSSRVIGPENRKLQLHIFRELAYTVGKVTSTACKSCDPSNRAQTGLALSETTGDRLAHATLDSAPGAFSKRLAVTCRHCRSTCGRAQNNRSLFIWERRRRGRARSARGGQGRAVGPEVPVGGQAGGLRTRYAWANRRVQPREGARFACHRWVNAYLFSGGGR